MLPAPCSLLPAPCCSLPTACCLLLLATLEQIELKVLLKRESRGGEDNPQQLKQRVEQGALKRQRYAHWAVAQLLCVGPLLPVHGMTPAEIDVHLTWAAEGERLASFSLLRPLLVFHFERALPIFYMHTRTPDVHTAALYESALMQPRGGDPRTSACMLHVRKEYTVLKGQEGPRAHLPTAYT